MKFQIATEELVRALSRVQGIVEKRSTNPIVSHVMLEATKSGLMLQATDTHVGFVSTHEAKVSKAGSICVAARPLFEILKVLPFPEIRLEQEDEHLVVEGGADRFQLRILPAEQFPKVPAFEGEADVVVSAAHFGHLIEQCAFAISGDEARTGLNGAYLEVFSKDKASFLRLVATDGHRLSLSECAAEVKKELSPSLVGRKALSELGRILAENDAPVEIRRDGARLFFKTGTIVFLTRLLEGQFPDYKQVIPKNWQRKVVVGRDAFSAALRKVSVLAPERSNAIRFDVKPDGIVLESKNAELGVARVPVDAEVEGKELSLGFNARYLRDVLQVLPENAVALELGDSLSPTVIRPQDNEHVLFVVMPLRIE